MVDEGRPELVALYMLLRSLPRGFEGQSVKHQQASMKRAALEAIETALISRAAELYPEAAALLLEAKRDVEEWP